MIYEQTPLQEKWAALKAFIKTEVTSQEALTEQILMSKEYCYNNWTKAVVLYHMSKGFAENNLAAIRLLKENDDIIIQETSIHRLQKLQLS